MTAIGARFRFSARGCIFSIDGMMVRQRRLFYRGAMEIAVIGAGAWGTALAGHAVRAGHQVTLWARNPAGRVSPDGVRLTDEMPNRGAVMLLAVPMQNLRHVLGHIQPAAPLLLCCKGMEHQTLCLPLEVAAAVHPGAHAAVLTGPNFAAEIAAGLPAAAVLAGGDANLRAELIGLLGTPSFRLYGQDDSVGAQLGGAAKNVVAIAAGAVIGAGLGENARAALITRGLAEIARLAVALGGKAETVAGLSGLGDLVLTCTGPASRNFSFGVALGRGATVADLLVPGAPTVEGVATASALVARAGDTDMPICRAVAGLLASHLTLPQAVAAILARKMRDE
jgi:glycerol-3-phosphate dehydrogenase (NAD(P)+)